MLHKEVRQSLDISIYKLNKYIDRVQRINESALGSNDFTTAKNAKEDLVPLINLRSQLEKILNDFSELPESYKSESALNVDSEEFENEHIDYSIIKINSGFIENDFNKPCRFCRRHSKPTYQVSTKIGGIFVCKKCKTKIIKYFESPLEKENERLINNKNILSGGKWESNRRKH